MRAEFFLADRPEHLAASAAWSGSEIEIDTSDETIRPLVRRIFRPAPVVVEDAALRGAGSAGPVVLQPGSLHWFAAAARARSHEEGLDMRLVPEGTGRMGFDPAGLYRSLDEQVELKEHV